ncbi:MAG: hypothetical protein H0T95_07295 [Chthoniobacterales bacterium]|nr:hypothetical protein [Chthoniobacterales bacterium]
MSEESVTLLALLGTIPAAVAFFAGLLFLDARITGWHALAQRFSATVEPANVHTRQNGGVGAVGLIHVKGLMRAAANDNGLYFAFPTFLSAGHPPLQIPWSEIRLVSDKHLLGVRIVRLEVGQPKLARVYLRGGIADAVAERLAAHQTA